MKKTTLAVAICLMTLTGCASSNGPTRISADGAAVEGDASSSNALFPIVGLFILGVTVVSAFNIETDQSMRAGESIEVAGHSFELRELRQVQGPNYTAIEGVVEIRKGGDFVAEVRPQKRQYLVQKNWMTEAGIQVHWNKDLFVALGDQLGNNTWSVRIQYKPMIRFIWLGCLIMALGGSFTMVASS